MLENKLLYNSLKEFNRTNIKASTINQDASYTSGGRINMFFSLSPLSQNLLQLIYPDANSFLQGYQNILEVYIITFDRQMDSASSVRALASQMGIYIPYDPNFQAYEIFVDKIVEYILTLGKLYPNKLSHQLTEMQAFPTTEEIIDMDRTTFNKIASKFAIIADDISYQDRMMVFVQLYKNTLS